MDRPCVRVRERVLICACVLWCHWKWCSLRVHLARRTVCTVSSIMLTVGFQYTHIFLYYSVDSALCLFLFHSLSLSLSHTHTHTPTNTNRRIYFYSVDRHKFPFRCEFDRVSKPTQVEAGHDPKEYRQTLLTWVSRLEHTPKNLNTH